LNRGAAAITILSSMSSAAPDSLAVVAHPAGLHVPALDLFLDPTAPVARAFLSHAHGDHVVPGSGGTLVASVETAALLRARFGVEVTHPLEWGQPLVWEAPIGPCTLLLEPAGHVLGAAQLVADTPAGRLVYTGDYQSGPGLTHASGSPIACDVLVIEATFGLPIFHFPPRDAVRSEIAGWCAARLAAGETPVLLAYALGKAQELIAALGEAGLPVIAHGAVLKMCRAYRELGVALPEVRPISAGDPEPGVLVVPPWARAQPFVKKRKNARIAYVSGWARIDAVRERFDADAVFPLSDHADFDDLLFTVRTSGARLVYTTYGHAAPFAALLRDLGVDARPLEALARDAHEQDPRDAREQDPRDAHAQDAEGPAA
jgi:Cft2 family RNA processing exonuclease